MMPHNWITICMAFVFLISNLGRMRWCSRRHEISSVGGFKMAFNLRFQLWSAQGKIPQTHRYPDDVYINSTSRLWQIWRCFQNHAQDYASRWRLKLVRSRRTYTHEVKQVCVRIWDWEKAWKWWAFLRTSTTDNGYQSSALRSLFPSVRAQIVSCILKHAWQEITSSRSNNVKNDISYYPFHYIHFQKVQLLPHGVLQCPTYPN